MRARDTREGRRFRKRNGNTWRARKVRRAINNSAGAGDAPYPPPPSIPSADDRISKTGARHAAGSSTSRSRKPVTAGIFSFLRRYRRQDRDPTPGPDPSGIYCVPRETIPESGNILTRNLSIVTSRHSFVIVSRAVESAGKS